MNVRKVVQKTLAVAVLSGVAAVANAVSMQPANLGLIVQYTENGFVGKAVSSTPVQTSQGWADEIVFEVTDPIIGKVHKNEKVTWRQVKSGENIPLAGMPSYQPGSEYVIFLTAKAPGSELQA